MPYLWLFNKISFLVSGGCFIENLSLLNGVINVVGKSLRCLQRAFSAFRQGISPCLAYQLIDRDGVC